MEFLQRLENMSEKRLKLLALELDDQVRELERARSEPIAIVGLGCKMPGGGDSPARYWELLDHGRDAIGEVPSDRWSIEDYFDPDPDAPGRVSSRWGGFLDSVDKFDAAFFGISRREAISVDPQQRILLEVCWEALENAGQSPHKLYGSQTGVYVGISTGDYYNMLLARGQDVIDAYLATGSAHSVAAGRIAYVLGLHGPNFPVDTACSSSLVAVHLAVQGLRNRECNTALAGGVNVLLSPDISIALSKSHMFAPDGRCKAFDASADGFVRSEGCGIVVLRRLSDAVADGDNILALIRGSAVNQDGRSSGITAPNGAAQEAVIRQALANARVEAGEIDYVEAHGTGTSLGDPIEAHALAAVLGQGRDASRPLTVGSVKTNLGHLESAAGIAGLIKVVLSMQHGRIPPHLHFQKLNPHIDWKGAPVEIPVQGKEWRKGAKARLAGVSSFGFGGTNAHVIVEEAPEPKAREATAPKRGVYTLALSARSEGALATLAERYAAHLSDSEQELGDICYTANTGRADFAERAVYIAASREEMGNKLREGVAIRGRGEGLAEVAFLFTGQGAQYAGMGRELYETEPVFRKAIETCAAAVKEQLQPGLIELLYGDASEQLNDTRYTQPAGFALQYGLAELWRSWGVEPAVVLGHSVGEYAAACVAGMYGVEEGMRLITARGRLTGSLRQGEGAMAAVVAPKQQVMEAVERLQPWVSIAAYNGPESVVIAGRVQEVERISEEFEGKGVQVERLRVSHGFHSPLMEEVAWEFAREHAGRIEFREPRVMMLSTVTGGAVGLAEAGSAEHWRRQVREAVRFEQALGELAKQNCVAYIEVGPGSTLLGMGSERIGREGDLWAPSIRRSMADNQQMAESLAGLYVRGVAVDWEGYEAGRGRRRVSLPTYPFERQRYWLDARAARAIRRRNAKNPLLGVRTDSAVPVYEGTLDLESAAWIWDHRVAGSPVVPAAAYLEVARAAADDALGDALRAVAGLHLKEPLRVDPDARVQIQTVLIEEESRALSFRIFSRPDTVGTKWTLHASGRLVSPQDVPGEEALNTLQERIAREVPASSLYDALAAQGIELGDASRNVRRLWTNEREALCQIRAGGAATNGALLDSCFQTVGAAVLFGLQAETEGTYVLQSVERFEQSQPLPETVFSHARILNHEHGSMTAELSVFGEGGNRIAVATGVRMRLFAAPATPAPRDWFYRVDWQEKPLVEQTGSTAGAIVSHADRIARWNEQAAGLASANGLDGYDVLRPAMDRVCAAYTVAALDRAGVCFEPGAALGVSQVRVVDKHARLLDRMLAILAEDGLLRHSGTAWEVIRRPEAVSPDALCEELEEEFPQFGAELVLLRRCGAALLEVLRGEADPLELLAPGGSFDALDRLYVQSPAAKVFNPLAKKALEAALQALPGDRTIRILEVGAGTGGTTTYLAPAIDGRNVEYVYTDVSPLFIDRAKETFRDCPLFRYGVLDIEQSPESQGFAPGQFDIVVAANVLHATADLRQTVRNVTSLLRASGLLMLVEGTQAERWVDVTFGMTGGWWKFEDTELRKAHPLLTRESWIELLRSEGYGATLVEPSSTSQQVLLLAEAPDRAPHAENRCLTVSGSDDLASGCDCDVLIFDATRGGSPGDVLSSLRAAAAQPVPPSVWLLTAGAQPVAADDKPSPEQAALWGIARTAALEYPQFWGGVIDVEPGMNVVDTVIEEQRSGCGEDQVAYRGGRRFAPRIVRDESIRPSVPHFDDSAAYLISGGLGNLGLETAEWLVRHGARRLVLTGRTAVREQKAESITVLEKLGARVAVVAADISEDAGIDRIREALGDTPLRGIIHTAAVFDSTPISDLTQKTFDSVLRPKAGGAERLLGLADGSLDFLVLFSSTTALMGVRGMAAYAAANAYLDSFACRARQAGVPAISVNWGTWELMRGTSEEDRQSYLRTGLHPMASAQALEALGDILTSGRTQVMAASIDWGVFKAVYEQRRRRPILDAVSGAAQPGQCAAVAEARRDLLDLLTEVPPGDRLATVVSVVRGEAAEVLALKPAEVDVSLGLFEMGMDSLMSVELKRRLEARCAKSLPSTLTFNYPSVTALARYLLDLLTPGLPAALDVTADPETPRDEREDLSEDELAGLLKQALDTVA